ncbi:MAG: tRNA (adenosine(37)-N6)-threonylcarbamoyltransferase complex dimerization subunit type 1 TsaB [Clostridia bacterium]|nr:tRNA (adenosine(37)-N6)-threonylcarbamoyltransferase complex dimerization subunit type 1 TsaB [Clostridia bacterium]
MIILGMDTSCAQASCALSIEGSAFEKKSTEDKRKHSQTLMPMVGELLAEHGLKARDMDGFAISCGPGSFTGLRIGMAAIKGLAFPLGKKISCVNSLDILANGIERANGIICPIIDARNNQVYTALYKKAGSFSVPVTEYMGIGVMELARMLKEEGTGAVICGDASQMHREVLAKESGTVIDNPGQDFLYPSAGVLVNLVLWGYPGIRMVEASEAVPFYLRVPQAERLYGK